MKLLLFTIALLMPLQAIAEWTPPKSPDPSEILDEARSDAREGRWEDALAKHIWIHDHALEFEPSFSGARLAIALEDWYDLAKRYPPAMVKLREARDAAKARVIAEKDKAHHYFHDFCSINEVLGQVNRTVALFIELDKNSPETAQLVYNLAQPALLKAKNYNLCGKYLQPDEAYMRLVKFRQMEMELVKETPRPDGFPINEEQALEMADVRFLESTANIVALLTLNDREREATRIAEDARSKVEYPDSNDTLDAALKGKMPGSLVMEAIERIGRETETPK